MLRPLSSMLSSRGRVCRSHVGGFLPQLEGAAQEAVNVAVVSVQALEVEALRAEYLDVVGGLA